MHRATPANSSFRAYTGGGTRSAVDTIDDSKLMQEMSGNFMHNETRQAIESPQNYGFTSVVAPATKGGDGSMIDSAEAVISFMGSNRSFPVASVMDDRRHRLRNMKPGDVAMFRQAIDKLQFQLTQLGAFLTGPRDKTVRMQLLDQDSQQSSSSGGSSSKGQDPIYQDAQSSYRYVHCTKDETACSGKSVKDYLDDMQCYRETTNGNVYLGADHTKNQKIVVTIFGPAKNTLAQV
ncbi:MAG TPA: phage baseplate assembly protein [Xanthobacteraceae bacterium]|jgi:hypothetical protein